MGGSFHERRPTSGRLAHPWHDERAATMRVARRLRRMMNAGNDRNAMPSNSLPGGTGYPRRPFKGLGFMTEAILPEHRDLDPGISDAIVSGRRMGLKSARDAAALYLGPITDEQWSKMKVAWDRHWALPEETLRSFVDRLLK